MNNKEPQDKKSPEWREWKVRNIFGGLMVAGIKSSRVKLEHLALLHRFLDDVVDNHLEEIEKILASENRATRG